MRPRVNRQHVLHRRYERAVGLGRDDPVFAAVRLESVFLSVRWIVESLAAWRAELHHLALQQSQAPARISLGRLGAGQSDQPGLLLAVERAAPAGAARALRLDGREPFFHQLLAHPINHGNAGLQSLDDPAVAPTFAGFRDVGLQQDARLQKPLRRALALADHRVELLTLFRAQPHHITLHRRRLRRHDFLHRLNCDG